MRLILAALLSAAGTLHAKPVDFTSHAGMEGTCSQMRTLQPKSIASDAERVAYAICSALAIGREAATWWRTELPGTQFADPQARARVRGRVESFLLRITESRELLQRVNAKSPLFVVDPGTWSVDLDGNGEVSLHERYFFWTPKATFDTSFLERAHSEADYLANYQAPRVNVDQSDVLWVLAYCNFAEAALHLVLSYDLALDTSAIVLVDRERVRSRAYPRLREGIRQSMKLRAALLAETDDDREWIASPRQRNTSFPLKMDEQTFATWGRLLTELDQLLAGKTLLGGRIEPPAGQAREIDMTFGLCAPGTGIDASGLFTNPLPRLSGASILKERCVPADARRPMSGLGSLASESLKRNVSREPGSRGGEWAILRHLYWIN